ncbi:MAG: hypothetical protein KDA84_12565, partial [Planctomycetaceae bacterium]|nr:hypothetical protein [Planctomycetaceae bacterium]
RLCRMEFDPLSQKAVDAYLERAYHDASSDTFSSVCYEIQDNLNSTPRPVISHLAGLMWSDDPLGAASASGDIAWTLANHDAAESVAITCADATEDDWFAWGFCGGPPDEKWQEIRRKEESFQADIVRDLIPNPFQPTEEFKLSSSADSCSVSEIANRIYERETFDEMCSLGSVLQATGCTSHRAIDHCLNDGIHVRGCWVLDQIMEQKYFLTHRD